MTHKLTEDLERFRYLSDSMRDVMLIVRPRDGMIVEANTSAVNAYGHTREGLLAMNIKELRSAETRDLTKSQMATALEKGITFETLHVRRDGSLFPVEVSSRELRIGGERLLLSVVRDISDRTRAETAAKESEMRMRFALETSHTGAWDLDLVGHTAFRTLEHDRIFGYQEPLPEWTYEIFLNHVLPEDRQEVDEKFRHATEAHTDWSFECRIRRGDGETRWIWAAGRHQYDAEGTAQRMAGIVQDITERKKAEEALKTSEMRFRLAMKNAPVSVAVQDKSLKYTWAYNQRSARNDEIIGHSDSEIFTPEEAAKVTAIKRRVMQEDTPCSEEMWFDRPGGRMFLAVYWEPIHDHEGRVVGVGSATVDLTPSRLAQEALKASELRWSTTLSSIGDAVIATDGGGLVTFMNTGAESLTGWKLEDAARKPIADIFNIINETTKQAVQNPIANVLEKGIVVGLANHTVLKRRDGTKIPIDDSGAPIRDETGKITGVVLVFRDITERRTADAAVQSGLNRFYSVLSNMTVGILLATDNGVVEFANKAYCEMFNLKDRPEDLRNLTSNELMDRIRFSYAKSDEAVARVRELVSRGETVRDEEINMRDGRILSRDLVPMRWGGNQGGRLWVYRDITERQRANEQVRLRETRIQSAG